MNIEQAKTLRRGQLLRATTILGCGIEPGAVVIAHGPTEYPYVAFNWGSGFSQSCTGGNRYNIQNFDPWTPDRSIAVVALSPATNAQLQTASFRTGYRWSSYGVEVMHASHSSLLFCRDKTLRYNVQLGNPDYLYLNAADSLQWAAALLLLGGPGPLTIESILQGDLLSMVRANSTNELLRGLIRAATGKAVPKETIQAGGDAIIAWLLEAFNPKPVPQPLPASPNPAADAAEQVVPPTAPPPPQVTFDEVAPPPPERLLPVIYNFIDKEVGVAAVHRSYRFEGTIEVPDSIVAEGHEAVKDYIRAYCDHTEPGPVELDAGPNCDWEDWINGPVNCNFVEVAAQLALERQQRTLAAMPQPPEPTNNGGVAPE